ncbi:hypothetical protein CRE_23015 [Caenorhabditis remanei]|uniref:Uncharacterized protein n=1 Tax=Caenorhabditis remanei TaxID=31234 RepID=E3N4D0_CAERE|nr:hypothetical protein CRE_23015 [Caenorhabditis remanei]
MKIKASGEFFYDRQASLYSRTKLTAKDNIKLEFRAVFKLKAVAESYQATSNGIRSTVHQAPALADKTLVEAISIPQWTSIFQQECDHRWKLCPLPARYFGNQFEDDQECRYSALGASKVKSTLFHPDDMPIVDLMQSYPGFTTNFNVHSCFFNLF